jgi:hypothetical protein
MYLAGNGRRASGSIVAWGLFYELDKFRRCKAKSVSKSSITEARRKLPWQALQFVFKKAVLEDADQWRGHTVRALDGTYLMLPNSKGIRKKFRRRKIDSYPRVRLMCAFNINTCQPTAARVDSIYCSEGFQASKLIPEFNQNDILLLDRGFNSIVLWKEIREKNQHFVCRLKKGKLMNQLEESEKKDLKVDFKGLSLRVLKHKSIYLVTTLTDKDEYPRAELIELYKKRWTAETQYRRLKQELLVQKFHSQSVNGILQEVFAGLLLLSIVSGLVYEASRSIEQHKQVNFVAAIQICWRYLPLFICGYFRRSKNHSLLKKIVKQIAHFLQTIRPDRHYRRASKQPENKWIKARRRGNHVEKGHWKWSNKYR